MWPDLNPAYLAWLGGLLGLMVGSFLNVVIYRLPLMMQAQWARECAELTGQSATAALALPALRPHHRLA